MTAPPNDDRGQEQDAEGSEDSSLDDVFSGKSPVVYPPGSLASAPVVPCLAIGTLVLALDVGTLFFGVAQGGLSSSLLVGLLGFGAFATVLLSAAQVLVIRGVPRAHAILVTYATALLALHVVLGAVLVIRGEAPPLVFSAAGLAATGAAVLLLRSAAYASFATFFLLKRLYLERQREGARLRGR